MVETIDAVERYRLWREGNPRPVMNCPPISFVMEEGFSLRAELLATTVLTRVYASR